MKGTLTDNDFIVALLNAGATIRKEDGMLKTTGLNLKKEKTGLIVCNRGHHINPKLYGFDVIKIGNEIHFKAI